MMMTETLLSCALFKILKSKFTRCRHIDGDLCIVLYRCAFMFTFFSAPPDGATIEYEI